MILACAFGKLRILVYPSLPCQCLQIVLEEAMDLPFCVSGTYAKSWYFQV